MAVFVYRASAVPKTYDPVLENNSWADIAEASASGIAADLWKPGDTKKIIINGTIGAEYIQNLEIYAFILGINHNAALEGQNLIHFGIGKIGGVLVGLCDRLYNSSTSASGYFTMNTNNTNSGGWENCHIRKTVLGSDASPASPRANTFLSALSSDLRAVMKPITKYSDNTGGGSNTASYVTSTTDYLPLLSEFEIQGTRTYANGAEQNYQKQYEYYKLGNSKVHHKHNEISTASLAWLRSVYAEKSNFFCLVATGGSIGTSNAFYSWSISPIFAV